VYNENKKIYWSFLYKDFIVFNTAMTEMYGLMAVFHLGITGNDDDRNVSQDF
jgi:hypothetical protein